MHTLYVIYPPPPPWIGNKIEEHLAIVWWLSGICEYRLNGSVSMGSNTSCSVWKGMLRLNGIYSAYYLPSPTPFLLRCIAQKSQISTSHKWIIYYYCQELTQDTHSKMKTNDFIFERKINPKQHRIANNTTTTKIGLPACCFRYYRQMREAKNSSHCLNNVCVCLLSVWELTPGE